MGVGKSRTCEQIWNDKSILQYLKRVSDYLMENPMGSRGSWPLPIASQEWSLERWMFASSIEDW